MSQGGVGGAEYLDDKDEGKEEEEEEEEEKKKKKMMMKKKMMKKKKKKKFSCAREIIIGKFCSQHYTKHFTWTLSFLNLSPFLR